MTARHSFLQVKRLPRRRRKLPGLQLMGGVLWCHSTMSSSAMGAGLIARVAPGMTKTTIYQLCFSKSSVVHVVLSRFFRNLTHGMHAFTFRKTV